MRKYLKIVLGDWKNSNRDKRELRAAIELGYDVIVIASSKACNMILVDKMEGFHVILIPTRKFGDGGIKKGLGYLNGLCMFVNESRKVDASIISGHNYAGVVVGYFSQIGKKKKAKIIYDCHEFELYQKERGFFRFHFVKLIEKFVLNISNLNIMVTESIAEEVMKIYKLRTKPLVVRNVPEKKELHLDVIEANREEFRSHMHLSADGFIVMHHGGIVPGRGVEEAIRAVARVENVGLVLMGYVLDDEYKKKIICLVEENGIEDRFYFKNVVSFDLLYDYVAAADIGIALTRNTCLSFLYSLPNKLFENIQAMTPIIGSNLPEISAIIRRYDVGIEINPDDICEFVNAIEKLRTDKVLYQRIRKKEEEARGILCWQIEKEKLKSAIMLLENGV